MHLWRSRKWVSSWESISGQPGHLNVHLDVTCERTRTMSTNVWFFTTVEIYFLHVQAWFGTISVEIIYFLLSRQNRKRLHLRRSRTLYFFSSEKLVVITTRPVVLDNNERTEVIKDLPMCKLGSNNYLVHHSPKEITSYRRDKERSNVSMRSEFNGFEGNDHEKKSYVSDKYRQSKIVDEFLETWHTYVRSARLALHSTKLCTKFKIFRKKIFFVTKVTSETFLSISKNLKFEGHTSSGLYTNETLTLLTKRWSFKVIWTFLGLIHGFAVIQ
jgi:hypothetical protein